MGLMDKNQMQLDSFFFLPNVPVFQPSNIPKTGRHPELHD
jgi:hypothetical protein